VAADNILIQNFVLHLLCLLLIHEGHLDETESSASHRGFISHHYLVGHLAKLREILEQISL